MEEDTAGFEPAHKKKVNDILFIRWLESINSQHWRNCWDIDSNTVSRYLKIIPVEKHPKLFKALATLACQFYGCQKREIPKRDFVLKRYWVPVSTYDFIEKYWDCYSWISNFQKQFTWSWTDTSDSLSFDDLPTTQNIIQVDNRKVVSNIERDAKARIWSLSVELLDAKSDKEITEINESIDKLKKILSNLNKNG